MNPKRLISISLALCLSTFTTSAIAAPPSHNGALDGETVAVMPILLAGGSGSTAWQRFDIEMTERTANPPGSADDPAMPSTDMSSASGFGFAGSASQADIKVLKYGYYLGLLPARMASRQLADARTSATRLVEAGAVLDGLSPEVTDAVAQILRAVLNNKAAGSGFGDLMEAANRGLGSDSPRVYGYLITGVWAGLAAYSAMRNSGVETLLSMSGPMVTLLEEDAEFASADRRLADTVLLIVRELQKRRPNPNVVVRLGNTLLEEKAD